MAKSKMKQLALATGIALGGMGLLPSAQAVNIATDGLGQVLVFPYYSVRAGWQTLINVTNTSDYVVTAKVRFHEAWNSRDVFDFTLILSPHDVWTAVVEDMTAAGAGIPASDPDQTNRPSIRTTDTSCTVPPIPVDATPGVGLPFDGVRGTVRTFGRASYTNLGNADARDGGPILADRMREGYVKVIMTGAQIPTFDAAGRPTNLAARAVHVNDVPIDCGALVNAFSNTTGIATLRAEFPVYNNLVNPLKGSYNLVKVSQGMQVSGSPVALADFYRTALLPALGNYELPNGTVGMPTTPGPNYLITLQLPPERITPSVFSSSYHEPNLNAANTLGEILPAEGSGPGETVFTSFPDLVGANSVNYLLRRDSVVNQWANTTTPSWTVASDWVITHPTKRYYVDVPPAPGVAPAQGGVPPHQYAGYVPDTVFFGRPGLSGFFPLPYFTSLFVNGASCEPVDFVVYNREERTVGTGPVFSPTPVAGNALCRELNVLTFGGSNVLGSDGGITSNVPADALPGGNGWMQLDFMRGKRAVIGFSATTRNTGNNLMNNAFLVDHAYKRR